MARSNKKKMKILGEVDYINAETGEIEKMQTVKLENRDFNFEKIWLIHILDSLEAIGNQKIKVMTTLLEMKDSNNKITATQKQICQRSGVSIKVVNQTLKVLIDSGFLKKQGNGFYQINPETIFKGGQQNRMNVLLQYRKQTEIKISENPESHLLTNQENQSELDFQES